MTGPEAARPSVGGTPLRAGWLAALGVAFVGQVLAWTVSAVENNGLIVIAGAIATSLLVGFATHGPWVAGAAGVVLASVTAGIGASVLGPRATASWAATI